MSSAVKVFGSQLRSTVQVRTRLHSLKKAWAADEGIARIQGSSLSPQRSYQDLEMRTNMCQCSISLLQVGLASLGITKVKIMMPSCLEWPAHTADSCRVAAPRLLRRLVSDFKIASKMLVSHTIACECFKLAAYVQIRHSSLCTRTKR